MEENFEIEEPVYRGLRGGSTVRGGIAVDIAKSALQKAIRRGNTWLAWMMGLRLNELKLFEGKPIRSNMINRLPIITGEDIGMGNLSVIKEIDLLVTKLRDEEDDKRILIEVIALMSNSEKSRLGSHVNSVFYQAVSTPEYYPRLNELKPSVLSTFLKIELKNPPFDNLSVLNASIKLNEEDEFLVQRSVYLIDNAVSDEEKMATFFYIRHLLNSENKYKISRGYPKKRNIQSPPIYFIWNHLLEESPVDRRKYIEILYKQFLNENEPHIYLILSLFVFFFYKEVYARSIDVTKIIEEFGGLEKIVADSLHAKVEIPDYVVDKHTKKGRGQGKDSVLFAKEGAFVTNESKWMEKWKDLADIYIDFREFCPSFSPKKSVFELRNLWLNLSEEKTYNSYKKEVEEKIYNQFLQNIDFPTEDEEDLDYVFIEEKDDECDEVEKTDELEALKDLKDDEYALDTVAENKNDENEVGLSKEKRIELMSDNTPRGQILTSKWKKYVYVPLDDDYVYKGPWDMKKGSTKEKEKMKKLKFRFDVCELMNSNVLRGIILKDDEGNMWVKYKKISNPKKMTLHKILDKVSDKEIFVAKQNITTLASHPIEFIYEKIFLESMLYCDFLLLYLLGVGDTGLYNVLVTEDNQVYIIDIDDDTTKTEFTEVWSIFGRRPREEIVNLIEKGVKNHQKVIRTYLESLEDNIDKIIERRNDLSKEEMLVRLNNIKNVVLNKIK